jgi:UDP-2,3-diacylglucosamine pyrophosphatase LpxH
MKRKHYRTVFLSDIHLGFKDCKAEYLLSFLKSIECDTLYLLGDIVDMWAMKKRFLWPSSHYEVLKAIFKMAKKGTRIIYIPGNHDEPMRDYIENMIGPVEIHEDFVHVTAQEKKLLLFHGDILDSQIRFGKYTKIVGDLAYDLLLFINRWGNFFRRRFGFSYFSLAYYLKNSVKNAREAIEVFEEAAANEAKRRGLDGVVCGHIHQAEIRVIDGILYCNDGDWIESCTAMVEDETGHLEIIHWSDLQKSVKKVSIKKEGVETVAPNNEPPLAARGFA